MFKAVDLVLAVYVFLILYKIKICKLSDTEQSYLSIDNTKSLRGAMAVLIVLHHLSDGVDGGVIKYLAGIGYLVVTTFFFFSGYGISFQYKKRGSVYLNDFLVKHVLYTVVLLIIDTCVYLAWYLIEGKTYTVASIALSFFNGRMIATSAWYLMPLILYYISFWTAFKFIRDWKASITAITAFQISLLTVYMSAGYDPIWYISGFSFTIGVIWALQLDRINLFLRKHYTSSFVCSIVLFLLFSLIPPLVEKNGYDSSLLRVICRIISTVLFAICIVLISRKVQLGGKVWRRMGSISLEIYLFHGLIYHGLRGNRIYIEDDFQWVVLSVCGAITIACLANLLLKKIPIALSKLTIGKSSETKGTHA